MFGFFYLIGFLIWLSVSWGKAANKNGNRIDRCLENNELTWISAVDGKSYLRPDLFGYGVRGHVEEDENGDRIIYSDRLRDKGKRLMNYDEHMRQEYRDVIYEGNPMRTVIPVGERMVLPKLRKHFKSMVYEDMTQNAEGKYNRYVIYKPGYKSGAEYLLNLETLKLERLSDYEQLLRDICKRANIPYPNESENPDEVIRKFNNDEITNVPYYCVGEKMRNVYDAFDVYQKKNESETGNTPKWYREAK